jgi:hypothetical protein
MRNINGGYMNMNIYKDNKKTVKEGKREREREREKRVHYNNNNHGNAVSAYSLDKLKSDIAGARRLNAFFIFVSIKFKLKIMRESL